MRTISAGLIVGTMLFLAACAQGEQEPESSPTPSFALETSPTTAPASPSPAATPPPVSTTVRAATSTTVNPPASQACDSNIERVYSLGSMGSNCDTARRVAAAYDARVMAGGTFPAGEPIEVDDGWSCRTTSTMGDGGEVFGLLCTKGTESITFQWGV